MDYLGVKVIYENGQVQARQDNMADTVLHKV